MAGRTRIRSGELTVEEILERLHAGLDRWAETVIEHIDRFEEPTDVE